MIPRPPVSVALCCYNGAQYVRRQIESIMAQSHPVDEIVVCDDGSSDGTPDIVSSLSERSAVPLTLYRNPHRLGISGNFEHAISLTRGEIVFLSDQDDLWYPTKVRDMVREFERREDLLLLHADARLVNAQGEPLGLTLFEGLEMTRWERTQLHSGGAFGALVRRNLVTGATAAFRREMFEIARPFPNEWVHDEWLGLIAAASGSVDFLEYPLIDYRQHGGNQIGVPLLSWREKLLRVVHARGDFHHKLEHRAQILFDRLQELGSHVSPARREWVRDKLLHAHVRGHLPSSRIARLPIVLQELGTGRYHQCSTGWRSVVRDMIEPIHTIANAIPNDQRQPQRVEPGNRE